MDKPIPEYWRRRLADTQAALRHNHFEAHVAETPADALRLVMADILPATGAVSVAWGGSRSLAQMGLLDALRQAPGLQAMDTFDKNLGRDELLERRRQALLVDCFFTSANALTETGMLVNLDMTGNRVAALTFGPRHVVVVCGRNKLAPDTETAMRRVKEYAAPVNAMRLDKKTPCVKTSRCQDCNSLERICNTWVITQKCCPTGRIHVVLVNEELGF